MDYAAFLASKSTSVESCGIDNPQPISPVLFGFQRDIVEWAVKRGRAAIFADCGLGKTLMQLEWARHVARHTGKNVLILAPLAVSAQTAREGDKLGVPVHVCVTAADIKRGINVTNYEKLHHFAGCDWGGIVLDESSILKAFDGKTRKMITEYSEAIGFRLCCTATPAPNDLIEITNHAEFLGVMGGKEIIALFFTQDGNTTHKWRLKGHAKADFWRWMASWSVALRSPADIGHDSTGFVLPELRYIEHITDSDAPEGMLFALDAQTLQERRSARKGSLERRVAIAAELARGDEPVIVWCDFNDESDALTKAIPGAIEIKGADSTDHKERALNGFSRGEFRVLVTKPSIAGFGMNWQHCARMIFAGLSDSYEQYYQAIRRCWRFGQTRPVQVHLITSEAEGAVRANIERKEKEATMMMENIVRHMSGLQCGRSERDVMEYQTRTESGKSWTAFLGDSIERLDEVADDSIGLSVFSPPFPGMYAYTNSPRDIGNCRTIEEMLHQFSFLIPQLLRVLMPGRHVAMHITQAVAFKGVDGYIGMKDFRGMIISLMQEHGFIYYGEVTIDKNPQVKAIRTRDSGLQFKSLATDSARMHMALADYILQFKKPGDNPVPIRAGISEKYANNDGWITPEEWILWARPVWYGDDLHPGLGIRETDVLNVSQARDTDDEKHLCPLQLGVIERCVKLWTNPGETVLSPFLGVGSEGVVSIQHGRSFVGCELKESYFNQAVKNLRAAEKTKLGVDMVDLMDAAV